MPSLLGVVCLLVNRKKQGRAQEHEQQQWLRMSSPARQGIEKLIKQGIHTSRVAIAGDIGVLDGRTRHFFLWQTRRRYIVLIMYYLEIKLM